MSKSDMCVSLSTVKTELRGLLNDARQSGNKQLEKSLAADLELMAGPGTKRARVGGADKMCHVITTAMFMSSGAAITYLTYMNVVPSVLAMVPRPCAGPSEQVLGYITSWLDPNSSCAVRQAAWDRFTKAVLAAAGVAMGQETYFGLARKSISKIGDSYKKVFDFNKKNVCPVVEKIVSSTTRGVCYTITEPFRILHRALLTATEVFDAMHGIERPSSASSRSSSLSASSSVSPSMKRMRTTATSMSASPSSAEKAAMGMRDIREFLSKPKSKSSSKASSKGSSKSKSKSKSKSRSSSKGGRQTRRRVKTHKSRK